MDVSDVDEVLRQFDPTLCKASVAELFYGFFDFHVYDFDVEQGARALRNFVPIACGWCRVKSCNCGLIPPPRHHLSFGTDVISVRTYERVTKKQKGWSKAWIAVEDPFEVSHNLTKMITGQVWILVSLTRLYYGLCDAL